MITTCTQAPSMSCIERREIVYHEPVDRSKLPGQSIRAGHRPRGETAPLRMVAGRIRQGREGW